MGEESSRGKQFYRESGMFGREEGAPRRGRAGLKLNVLFALLASKLGERPAGAQSSTMAIVRTCRVQHATLLIKVKLEI